VTKIIATFNIYDQLKLLYSVKDGRVDYLSSVLEKFIVFKVMSLQGIYFSVSQQPNVALRTLRFEVYMSQTDTHTHTHDRTSLNELSARRRGRYLHNAQQTQDQHPFSLRDSNMLFQKSSGCKPSLRPQGHRYRQA
jgi:hypothetical protein